MAYGRKTGGRQKGTRNKIAKPRAERIYDLDKAVAGMQLLPVPYMLQVLNDPASKPLEKAWAAEKAAPYLHARLAPIDQNTGLQPVQTVIVKWLGDRQPMKSSPSLTSLATSSGATTTDKSDGPASSHTGDAAKRWPA